MAECGYTPKDQLNTSAQAGLHLPGSSRRALHSRARSLHWIAGRGLVPRHRHGSWPPSWTRALPAPTSCWATAKSRKARSGKQPCSRGDKKVDNLVAIVDYNHIQLDGFVNDIMPLEPLADKWRAFNWHTIELEWPRYSRVASRVRRSRTHPGQADRDHCAHHQRQGSFVHGEQSQVSWRRAHRARNGKSVGGT